MGQKYQDFKLFNQKTRPETYNLNQLFEPQLIWLAEMGLVHQASKARAVKKGSVVGAGKDYLYWPVTLSDGQALKGKDE